MPGYGHSGGNKGKKFSKPKSTANMTARQRAALAALKKNA